MQIIQLHILSLRNIRQEMQKLALYELLTYISNKAQIHGFMTIIYKMVEC